MKLCPYCLSDDVVQRLEVHRHLADGSETVQVDRSGGSSEFECRSCLESFEAPVDVNCTDAHRLIQALTLIVLELDGAADAGTIRDFAEGALVGFEEFEGEQE